MNPDLLEDQSVHFTTEPGNDSEAVGCAGMVWETLPGLLLRRLWPMIVKGTEQVCGSVQRPYAVPEETGLALP